MYKNGKIYKLVSDITDKIYIGSTVQPLNKRHSQHINSGNTTFSKNLGNTVIILIEDYPCERKEQLFSRERYWIELNKDICINKVIPTRTIKEYYQDNKDSILEQVKKHYKVNRESKLLYAAKYREDNNEIIKTKEKVFRDSNKEKIQEYKKTVIECICGSTLNKGDYSRHLKTKKHLNNV